MNGYSDEPPHGGGGQGGAGGILAAAIAAGAMVYDGYWTRRASKENTDKTIAAQKSESELAYQRSIDMWNRQNMYNSPQAQMARFQQAGLNPHLIYGSGSGGAGNASGYPEYRPAHMEYNYKSGNYGAAIASILPMLMSVGSWMQDMRIKDMQLRKGSEDIDLKGLQQAQLAQLISYLEEKNPKVLKDLENQLSLFPYQKSMQRDATNKSFLGLADLESEFLLKNGYRLFEDQSAIPAQLGGTRAIEAMKKQSELMAQQYKTKLLGAQSSWTDYDITNPQALMQLVLGGVMNLAGTTMKFSAGKFNRSRREVVERSHSSRGSYNRYRRTVYE